MSHSRSTAEQTAGSELNTPDRETTGCTAKTGKSFQSFRKQCREYFPRFMAA